MPTAIREVRNNPGKRPINHDEPDLEVSAPAPPDYLSDDARARWLVIAPALEAAGIITQIDASALAAYCTVWVRWQRAEAGIDSFGDVVKTPNGMEQQSPYIGMANQALKQVRAYEAEFGMTPSSRTRVKVTPRPPKSQTKSFEDRIPRLKAVK